MKSNVHCTSIFVCLTLALLSVTAVFAADKAIAIPAGSKLYVVPNEGFDTFLTAALNKKKVPLTIVTDKDKADYIVESTTQSEKAGWAKVIFTGRTGSAEEASIRIINVKTSEVVFAYAVNKGNSVHGKQSSAEACAKHLKEVVQ
jgi:hypothetical protein